MDSRQGSCKSPNGWCLYRQESGSFECDEQAICPRLLGKNQTNACTTTKGQNTICCCRQSDGCAIAFADAETASGSSSWQRCYHARESPSSSHAFRECHDPWCYTLFTHKRDGGALHMEFGCQSRQLVKHDVFREQYRKFGNNTAWKRIEAQYHQPRCHEITTSANQSEQPGMCYDFVYRKEKGRLCCCRGEDRCNQDFSIRSPSLDATELARIRREMNVSKDRSLLKSVLFLLTVMLWD